MAEPSSSCRKRARDIHLPELGDDASLWLPDHNASLRYGTSLRLMASCSAFLNDSEEFNEVDPNSDWEKWSNRVPGAFSLFYAAIVDPLQPEGRGVHAVLRAVLDGWPSPVPPHRSRLIIGGRPQPAAASARLPFAPLLRHHCAHPRH